MWVTAPDVWFAALGFATLANMQTLRVGYVDFPRYGKYGMEKHCFKTKFSEEQSGEAQPSNLVGEPLVRHMHRFLPAWPQEAQHLDPRHQQGKAPLAFASRSGPCWKHPWKPAVCNPKEEREQSLLWNFEGYIFHIFGIPHWKDYCVTIKSVKCPLVLFHVVDLHRFSLGPTGCSFLIISYNILSYLIISYHIFTINLSYLYHKLIKYYHKL